MLHYYHPSYSSDLQVTSLLHVYPLTFPFLPYTSTLCVNLVSTNIWFCVCCYAADDAHRRHKSKTQSQIYINSPRYTVRCRLQIMIIFLMWSSTQSCYFLFITFKYSSQHPVLKTYKDVRNTRYKICTILSSRGFCVAKKSREISRDNIELKCYVSQAVSIIMCPQQPLVMENDIESENSEATLMQFKTIRTGADGKTI
jgi:hypothetical protein